ncbi:hypothetical protein OS493_018425 [Desmophyllum pertusum]|uniref:Uncharacterized protein n=1 Tax=Desmophyllum pertusum TaxID=174260 RepID=A0A9X0A0Y7_9CNID|nr:hypothetical protein OS493_018425 [Desmophyllum pertusum]
MDFKYLPLDLPVSESKDLGEGRVIYSFKKDEHAKLLLKNLSEMQADEGLLTGRGGVHHIEGLRRKPFHSMLLAACSPVIKRSLTGKHYDCTAGILSLKGLTTDVLQGFRDFLLQGRVPIRQKIGGLASKSCQQEQHRFPGKDV